MQHTDSCHSSKLRRPHAIVNDLYQFHFVLLGNSLNWQKMSARSSLYTCCSNVHWVAIVAIFGSRKRPLALFFLFFSLFFLMHTDVDAYKRKRMLHERPRKKDRLLWRLTVRKMPTELSRPFVHTGSVSSSSTSQIFRDASHLSMIVEICLPCSLTARAG